MAQLHDLYAMLAAWYAALPGGPFSKTVTPEDLDALKRELLTWR